MDSPERRRMYENFVRDRLHLAPERVAIDAGELGRLVGRRSSTVIKWPIAKFKTPQGRSGGEWMFPLYGVIDLLMNEDDE